MFRDAVPRKVNDRRRLKLAMKLIQFASDSNAQFTFLVQPPPGWPSSSIRATSTPTSAGHGEWGLQ
jgi:hypothetical protein